MPIEYPKEFFKIVQNHELQNGELRLPKKFVEKHWKVISNPIVLRLPNGDKHKISWVNRDGDIWLQKNWEKIAKFLKHGYVVVFTYKGGSDFEVKIFGLNTLEIDLSNITKLVDESCEAREVVDVSDEDDDSDGEMNGVGTSQRRKTSKRKMNVDFDATQQKSSGRKRGDMIKKARKCSTSGAVNVNPSFEVKLSKSYALPNGYTLRLPTDFSQKYLNGYNGTASIRVDEEDMAMEVKVKFQDIDNNRTCFITKGWSSFIQQYNLQADDKCEFEMIQREPLSFTITIIRARGMNNSCDDNIGKRTGVEGTSRSCHVYSNLEGHNVMQPIEICVSSDYPYIRSDFFDRHRELHNKDVKLKMGEKSWDVTVKCYEKSCRFYKGWRIFKNGCKLDNGDSIFLKLIDEEKLVFEVSFE